MLLPCGCHQWYIDDADREVAVLIQSRQRATLGFTNNADVGYESGNVGAGAGMYRMVPSPVDSAVPKEFRRATMVQPESPTELMPEAQEPSGDPTQDDQSSSAVPDELSLPDNEQTGASSTPPTNSEPQLFTLSDALAYSMRHARRYQTEKEILYLGALDLTLERFLWTPRFINSVLSLDYSNAGQAGGFDQATEAVSNFAIEQRLPYGGEITARVINTLMRNLGSGVTSGESGQFILETRLPLLRGAGPVAYENRYLAERRLVYAIRRFERFRREFLVDIASEYFDLLSSKARIRSAEAQAMSLAEDYRRDKALADAERILYIDADRTRVSMLNSENAALNAREQFDTSLDFFKIRVGMPTETPIDVVDEALDLVDPRVATELAIRTAVKYRLDLITDRDEIDDARRAVKVAGNSLLPQLDFNGSVTVVTDPEHRNSFDYNTDRTSWEAGLEFELPLNRKRERNDYRSSLIRLRQAERNYDESLDTVRLEVRRAMRRIDQTRTSMEIQAENIEINEFRAAMARAKFEAGELPSNRDVVEAEDDLRNARNDFAAALSQFRRAVLEFLRDTGTLRVRDDGKWALYDPFTGDVLSQKTPDDDERAHGQEETAGATK